jgi:hypothetical protein
VFFHILFTTGTNGTGHCSSQPAYTCKLILIILYFNISFCNLKLLALLNTGIVDIGVVQIQYRKLFEISREENRKAAKGIMGKEDDS